MFKLHLHISAAAETSVEISAAWQNRKLPKMMVGKNVPRLAR